MWTYVGTSLCFLHVTLSFVISRHWLTFMIGVNYNWINFLSALSNNQSMQNVMEFASSDTPVVNTREALNLRGYTQLSLLIEFSSFSLFLVNGEKFTKLSFIYILLQWGVSLVLFQEFRIGCFCADRASIYHRIQHYVSVELNQSCKEKVVFHSFQLVN